jgi:hypothetical protein
MANGLDIITGALRRINAYMPGENISDMDANDALDVLNDLLDSLSTQESYVYGSLENILAFTPGQYQYTIGTGGNFNVARPLRITKAFTRITNQQANGLDYPMDILSQQEYADIGLKRLGGPWPIAVYYNPTYPLGNLYFYPNPSGAGELHLFTDTILTNMSLAGAVSLPQGYKRALKWLLAGEIASEYGITPTPFVMSRIKESTDAIKELNRIPVPLAQFDATLIGTRRTDAGWILHGGFAS